MMKKTLLVATLAFMASGAAMANGFYAGVGAGGINFNNDQTVTETELADGTTTTGGNDMGNLGVNGTVFAGYAWTLPNKFFLGVEAFGDYTSARTTSTFSESDEAESASVKNELNYVYGARVLPGYQVTPETVAYAILGVARADVKVVTSMSEGAASMSSTSDYYFDGGQVGLGSMTDIGHNLGLRGDIIYTGYKSKTFNGTDADGDATVSIEDKLSTFEGDVSLVYKFG